MRIEGTPGRSRTQTELPVRRDANAPLTCDQIARIRERIRSGAYDSVHVMDAVIRRILAAGDLAADR